MACDPHCRGNDSEAFCVRTGCGWCGESNPWMVHPRPRLICRQTDCGDFKVEGTLEAYFSNPELLKEYTKGTLMITPAYDHELKAWPDMYRPMKSGEKPFDVRLNDRGFQRGDTVWLREWDPNTKEYTGEGCRMEITYVLSGWGLQPNHVALGYREIE